MSRSVPVHRSLVVRLLGTAVLIVVLAVATAAWLAAKTATRAAQEERGQTLAGDALIYDTLLGYAAGHPRWDGVAATVERLAAETGREITLTTGGGAVIASTSGPPAVASPVAAGPPAVASPFAAGLPERPSAVIDPLGAASGTIDPRAVGPYRLSAKERAAQREVAEQRLACLRTQGISATLETAPSGRSILRMAERNPWLQRECPFREDRPTARERAALHDLKDQVVQCLKARHLPEIDFYSADSWQIRNQDTTANRRDIQDCVDSGRRAQLEPWVAAPARLYLSDPVKPPAPVFDLSAGSALRIAGATGFVLLVAITATLVVGLRLVRPLWALTAAADRAASRPAPVPISRNDEIGRLAAAFNDLAGRSERSEQQRRTMVDDIAHELRSPLTNIRNWLTAGQDGLADLDQDMLRLLLEETGVLQHIVDDLADLAEADAGTLTLNRGAHHVGDLLAPVCEAHRGVVPVSLTVDADVTISVDPVRFRQIVGNLLGNAIRHTPATGRIDVRARIERGDLVVDVADTGEGIAEADLPYVFDRFWRADRARARATGGSGLGLSIAHKLVQAHGGEISVTSSAGVGSTFSVRLPLLHQTGLM